MNVDEIIAKVRDLRNAQKTYSGTEEDEVKMKALEKELDEAIEEYFKIGPLDQDTPKYVSLDQNPPDIKNGRYTSFGSKIGTTFVQVLECREVYFKTVCKDGRVMTVTYTGPAADALLKYFTERDKETEVIDLDEIHEFLSRDIRGTNIPAKYSLYESGYKTIEDIYNASRVELLRVRLFGKRSLARTYELFEREGLEWPWQGGKK